MEDLNKRILALLTSTSKDRYPELSRVFELGGLYITTDQYHMSTLFDMNKKYDAKVLQFGPKVKVPKHSILLCIRERIIPDRRKNAKNKHDVYEVVFLFEEKLLVLYCYPEDAYKTESILQLAKDYSPYS